MSRNLLVIVIVLGLAVVALALLRAPAQTGAATIEHQNGGDCVSVCALPGPGHGLGSMTGQSVTDQAGPARHYPAQPAPPSPAQPVSGPYLPVPLRPASGLDL